MRGSGIDLNLEVLDILVDGVGLVMAFWVAGAEHLEIRLHGADVGYEVAGVVEFADRLLTVDVIAAQGEHGAHAGFFEHVKRFVDLGLVGVQGSEVGDCWYAVFLADRMGDACGGGAVGVGAMAVGHGNEVGVQALEPVEGVVDGADRRVALGREYLESEHRGMHIEFLTTRMKLPPLAGLSGGCRTGGGWNCVITTSSRLWRQPPASGGLIRSYFSSLARTALAAATRCSRLGQVSALPRVFRPQSGLIHTFLTSILSRIS